LLSSFCYLLIFSSDSLIFPAVLSVAGEISSTGYVSESVKLRFSFAITRRCIGSLEQFSIACVISGGIFTRTGESPETTNSFLSFV